MRYEMKMPDLATTESDVGIVRWLVQPGERVERGQPLVEVETDKAIMEIESVVSGLLVEVRAQAGDDVPLGQVIGVLVIEGAQGHNVGTGHESSQVPSGQWAPYERDFLLTLYERMALIRQCEDGIKFLFLEGAMPGTIHQCQGQEATAVGVCSALRADDFITSTFRGHGHALAKGLSVQELLDELFGAESGCCRGKGGSMHVGNMVKGMVPGIAIVGGGIPLAAGIALAFQMQKSNRVVACFFGDGAVAEGAFHEGVNMAAIWNLPVIFACENNLYGASTHVSKVMCDTNIARRAASYGLRTQQLDGNDVLAVYEAAQAAVADCRAARGPVLLEMQTYRRTGHSRRDPCHYQPADERETWAARDPIDRFAEVIKGRGLIDDAGLAAIRARLAAEFQAAVEKARRAPPPAVGELMTDVMV